MMRRLVAVIALLAFVGCNSDSSTGASSTFTGTYNLTTINGSPLPFVAQASNPKIEVLAEQLVASDGGTFTQSFTSRTTNGTSVTTRTDNDSGTYTISGTTVSFLFRSDLSTGVGTLSGTTLTVVGGGFTSVYVKQ